MWHAWYGHIYAHEFFLFFGLSAYILVFQTIALSDLNDTNLGIIIAYTQIYIYVTILIIIYTYISFFVHAYKNPKLSVRFRRMNENAKE